MKKRNLFIFTFLLFFALFMTPAKNVSASGLTQSNPSKNSITVSWEPADASYRHVTNYYAQIAADYSSVNEAERKTISSNVTSYTFTGLSAGKSYYIKISCNYTTNYGSSSSSSVSSGTFSTTPASVSGLKQAKWWYYIKSVDATWNQQTGADGYEYVFKNADNKIVAHSTLTNSRYSTFVPKASCKISNNHVYTVEVRAYATICGKKYYSPYSKAYLFTQPMCTSKTKAAKNKLTIKWEKIKGISSYSVYVSTKEKSEYVKVKTVSSKTTSLTIKKLKKSKIKSNKTYYV